METDRDKTAFPLYLWWSQYLSRHHSNTLRDGTVMLLRCSQQTINCQFEKIIEWCPISTDMKILIYFLATFFHGWRTESRYFDGNSWDLLLLEQHNCRIDLWSSSTPLHTAWFSLCFMQARSPSLQLLSSVKEALNWQHSDSSVNHEASAEHPAGDV